MLYFLLLTLFLPFALVDGWSIVPLKGAYRIMLGPEVYHTKRTRKGGTHQEGYLYGGHASFERIRRRSIYWGVEGYYANGWANGKTASGSRLKSDVYEYDIEGRIGYTFMKKSCFKLLFVPYGGYGRFVGINKFKSPSPVLFKFRNTLEYVSAGFLSSLTCSPLISVGLNVKVKWVTEGKNRVTDDPDFNDVTQLMKNKAQYEVDVPLRIFYFSRIACFKTTIVPFYRYRHYGGRENFPFDLFDTKFRIYGLRLMLSLQF